MSFSGSNAGIETSAPLINSVVNYVAGISRSRKMTVSHAVKLPSTSRMVD